MTQAEQEALTPDEVITAMMEGNARFVSGELTDPDIDERITISAMGQYPKAVVLSCLDSRVPVELVFDQGIGDIFVGRVAGNIENVHQLGSMEFATKLSGAKLVMVLGHSGCGAIKGAVDGAELGNLTALLKEDSSGGGWGGRVRTRGAHVQECGIRGQGGRGECASDGG